MKGLPFRLVGAYDTETTNLIESGRLDAFPVTHQIGITKVEDLSTITADNVENAVSVHIYRHATDAYNIFQDIMNAASDYVPVIAVHNLGFDHTNLAGFFADFEIVQVISKSSVKPITYKICENDGENLAPRLVFLDTMGLFGKSLETMGNECGYPKLVGSWDYMKIRTPETPLTPEEVAYAEHDIFTLFAYFGYFLRNNEEIAQEDIGRKVTTKTGVVRVKRLHHLKNLKGNTKNSVGRMWSSHNTAQKPKTDDEMFTQQASTRGGFTFTASNAASVVFETDGERSVFAFDAASQHPAQMVSHMYPQHFKEASVSILNNLFSYVTMMSIDDILDNWYRPFPFAFDAFFKFTNIRPKEGSLYEKHGISPIAAARIRGLVEKPIEGNEQMCAMRNHIAELGYKDYAVGYEFEFGKLIRADECGLYLTELSAWEVAQAFDFDTVEAVGGYSTFKYAPPTDLSVLSVMRFYKAKNIFKQAKNAYERRQPIPNADELRTIAPQYLADAMIDGTASDVDVALFYQSLKADLNSLFGIEATNEAKPDSFISTEGIVFVDIEGIEDLPKFPKCDYYFGQRIVGWSRIAQHVVLALIAPYVDAIICGDTDSVKVYTDLNRLGAEGEPKSNHIRTCNGPKWDHGSILANLEHMGNQIDASKSIVCRRVFSNYPDHCDPLVGIGWYEHEATFDHFYCAWNKAYCYMEYDPKVGKDVFHFTIAGVTTNAQSVDFDDKTFDNSYNALATYYHDSGASFARICEIMLSYNVAICSDITKLNQRKVPKWGSVFEGDVTDYLGNTAHVVEPAAICLYPSTKTIGGFDNLDNKINAEHAKRNNPNVNTESLLIAWTPGKKPVIMNMITAEDVRM